MYSWPISLTSVIAFSFGHNHLDYAVETLVVGRLWRVTAFIAPLIIAAAVEQQRAFALRLTRNDHGPCAPERRIEQGGIWVETYAPDSQRPAGLLANLQAARAAICLIERNDNHTVILGDTIREIKLAK
jgi:hypothetical protein